ncbi:MAG: hypothetical protein AAF573_01490 [Bacteroidota bacterium]
MNEKEVLKEIIKGYRNLINERYQYDYLAEKYTLPEYFDEKRVQIFKNYFLDYLYPDLEKREELNEAFESLDNYIKHPEKLFRLVIDSGSLLFKYGRHLRKILGAGIKALGSFRTANNFEQKLVAEAIRQNLQPPFETATIKNLIGSLSPKDIDEFIKSNQGLFETFEDRELVGKIKDIIRQLIAKMKKRPNVYASAEVKGLEIGYDIIRIGDELFEKLSAENQQLIFSFLVKVERDALNEIFC